tara:strand:- start:271 stop:1158 length:888 start_codon:yes stop_codon:yes gene_type:complete
MEKQVSYYAIIPANVRYNENLPPNAKLLYGEITALCNQKGYCWSSNKYFADLYNVSKQTISVWVSKLRKEGFIFTEFTYKGGSKEIDNRYIKLSGDPILKNTNTPPLKNTKVNTTNINNTINIKKEKGISPEFEEVLDPNQISLIDEIKEKEKSCEKKGEGKLTKILIVDNKGNYHNLPISDVNFIKEKEKSSAKKETFNFRKEMIDLGFSEDLVLDWLAVRKTKKATNTKTALNGFLNQVKKTGRDQNEVLEYCINKSWSGFKSVWLEKEEKDEKSDNGNSAVDNLIKAMKVNQ